MRGISKKIIAVFVLMACWALPVLAQVPCSGDPDDANYDPNCPTTNTPLDTWVMVLVVLALFLDIIKLKSKEALHHSFN